MVILLLSVGIVSVLISSPFNTIMFALAGLLFGIMCLKFKPALSVFIVLTLMFHGFGSTSGFLEYLCRVKRNAKIVTWFYLAVLLSFTAVFFDRSFFFNDPEYSVLIPVDGQQNSFLLPADLTDPVIPSGNSIQTAVQAPVFLIKNQINHLIFCSKSAELVIWKFFTNYHFFASNIILRFRNPDIVFPFKYFW